MNYTGLKCMQLLQKDHGWGAMDANYIWLKNMRLEHSTRIEEWV